MSDLRQRLPRSTTQPTFWRPRATVLHRLLQSSRGGSAHPHGLRGHREAADRHAGKAGRQWTVPLCGYHHRTGIGAQHKMGERDFWELAGINPFEIAVRLFIESGGYEREMSQPCAPIVKRIKPRKPPEQRCKIPAGRPLQSRGFEKRRLEAVT